MKSPDKIKHDITTVLGRDVHEIVRKYSDKEKYDNYRKLFEKAKNLEDKVVEIGLDVHPLVDPLWIVIENMLKLQFGLDTTNLIMFYLYDRIGPDGKIIPLVEEESNKKFKLKTPKDLFSYIKFRYSDK